jgi:uracil permease
MPPIVTGGIACAIGIGLSKADLDMILADGHWAIALFTTLIAIGTSHCLRRVRYLGQVPVLIGAVAGYAITMLVAPDVISFEAIKDAPVVAVPHFTLPMVTGPLVLTAIFSVAIMAIATVPESTAHLYQMSSYIDSLAEDLDRPQPHLEKYVGLNLMFDGIGDMLSGLLGGPAGTNYGDNNSLMAITRNYSGLTLVSAGAISILAAFSGKVAACIGSVPVFVTGGLAL